jgi:hypothetical protein
MLRLTVVLSVLISTISAARSEPLAVWRLLSHQHFYTTDCQEAELAQLQNGYVLEGEVPVFYIETKPEPGTSPLYRFYNGRNHFYTTSRDAEGDPSYSLEGVLGYIYSSRGPNLTPLYRAFNPTTGDHLYTIGRQEYRQATQEGGYEREGIAGYVMTTGVQPCSPALHTMQPRRRDLEDEDCFDCEDEPILPERSRRWRR